MKLLATILSTIFHPLLMPTYGIAIALYTSYMRVFGDRLLGIIVIESWLIVSCVVRFDSFKFLFAIGLPVSIVVPCIWRLYAGLSDSLFVAAASNSKYVQTNFGIYPLKYFFSKSMQNDAGEEVSTREIKRLLEELVDHEDKHKPLSDDKLCELLQQKGYPIARRTIAKYREQLSIPVARLRKEI